MRNERETEQKKNIVITVNSTRVRFSRTGHEENREEIKDGSRLRIGEE